MLIHATPSLWHLWTVGGLRSSFMRVSMTVGPYTTLSTTVSCFSKDKQCIPTLRQSSVVQSIPSVTRTLNGTSRNETPILVEASVACRKQVAENHNQKQWDVCRLQRPLGGMPSLWHLWSVGGLSPSLTRGNFSPRDLLP